MIKLCYKPDTKHAFNCHFGQIQSLIFKNKNKKITKKLKITLSNVTW